MASINTPTQIRPVFTDFETVDARMSVNQQGFADIDVDYYAKDMVDVLRLLKTGKTCPLVASGMVVSALFKYGSAEMVEGGVYKVTLHWKGISPVMDLTRTIIPDFFPRGETQPIATHPQFGKFAGTFSNRNPDSQPEFDKFGRFVRFARRLSNGKKNPKAGIDKFYTPGFSVRDVRTMNANNISTSADLFNVGKIDRPPVDNIPVLKTQVYGLSPTNRNYILINLEIEDYANDFVGVTRDWLMSGPWGWDTDIYDYSDTGDAK